MDFKLHDYWRVVKKRKVILIAVIVLFTTSGIIYSLTLPPLYRAETTIMPIGGDSGGMAYLASQLGALGEVAMGGGGSRVQQKLLQILKSRTCTEKVISEFNLIPVIFPDLEEGSEVSPAIKELSVWVIWANHVLVTASVRGVITISARFSEPKLAADVANGFVNELQKILDNNSFKMAKRKRIFIEEQLDQNKRQLLMAGKELNEFYKGERVSSIDSKIDVPVRITINGLTVVEKKGEDIDLTSEAELIASRDNWLSELDLLTKRKDAVDSAIDKISNRGSVVKDVPQQIYLQYLALRRNLLASINSFLIQQYEWAKIDEARKALAFQVIDTATVPVARYSPNRKRITVWFFIFSIFFAVCAVFMVEYYYTMRKRDNRN